MKKTFITIFALTLLYSSSAPAKEKILIIQSYHPDLAWTAQCEKGIKEVLGSLYEIHSFYMDTKRIPNSEFKQSSDAAWKKYLEVKPVLVMTGDDNALSYLGGKLSGSGIPVVYFGINNNPRIYFANHQLPQNITGILERTPVIPWLRFLTQIIPDAKKALILMDSSHTSESIIDIVFQKRKSVEIGNLKAYYRTAESFNEWKEIISSPDNFDFILMPTFHAIKDKNDKNASVEQVIEWTSANTLIPVFTNQDYTVNSKGVIGAFVIFGEMHGKMAGEMVLEILENKKSPSEIKTKTDIGGKFYFNRDQLKRFKIILPEKIETNSIFQ